MGLKDRLAQLEPQETWPQLHDAAIERYWDGFALATGPDNRRTGAIYLLGYVAEILLKVAFYRVSNAPHHLPVQRGAIQTHRDWQGRRNLHDLVALGNVLIGQRKRNGIEFDPVFAALLIEKLFVLDRHWSEALRYRHSMATTDELHEVYQAVEWLLANKNTLWS